MSLPSQKWGVERFGRSMAHRPAFVENGMKEMSSILRVEMALEPKEKLQIVTKGHRQKGSDQSLRFCSGVLVTAEWTVQQEQFLRQHSYKNGSGVWRDRDQIHSPT